VVASAAEDDFVGVAGLPPAGGEVDFGGGVGGDENVPLKAVPPAGPSTFDAAGYRLIVAVDVVESFDGVGAEFYSGITRSKGPDAAEIFVFPDEQVAEEHHMVARIHGRITGVPVP